MQYYDLTCPGCSHEFTYSTTAATLADGGDLIECPMCHNEWEWEYLPDENELALLPDEEGEEDEDLEGEDQDDEDDEAPEDEEDPEE
jgi:hypothetical protein